MDLAEWLRRLGLEQYAPAFRDNDIDERVLRRLTAEDLRDLGVASIGHRRRLLDAIAALDQVEASPPPRGEAADIPVIPALAERRQLSVMFCDLVGSTALSARFDPEDLRELIGLYHRCVAATVARFDGFVAKYMGDGVLVYFGYPQAHEDDAERAVRAGLALIDAVSGLDAAEPLAVRLGVASGLVVVGDLIGAGSAQEQSVVGETPNLAARLQGLAAPATLVISDRTRRQVGGLFDFADLGPRPLAGFAQPQPAWRVLGESGVVSRFEALRSEATPLVGRDEEIDLLLRRWHQAKTGEGRVVLVSGEPGIGKSRLTAALSERIAGEPHTRLRFFCSPHHQDSALYPFIVQLERAAEFGRDDTAEQRLGKLKALAAPGTRDGDDIALLAELLSLPNEVAGLNLSPQRKREKLFEALLRQLDAVARGRPVLMVFEDAHWIDPTSRELLDLALHASLIARLDRLGTGAKEAAQIGAVLGREFSYELIEPVAQRPEAELRAGLGRLAEAGLLFCRGTPPHSSYIFKHALVQDAAYGTLLRSRRQQLHARVAAELEQHFADLVERQPELLAHHLTGAAQTERAIAQWLTAGQRATARSAHVEAIGHCDRGLALLALMPESVNRDQREIDLQLTKGSSLLTAHGFNSLEAAAAYERARTLCETHGDRDNLFVALWNLWLTTAVRDIDACRPLSKRLLTLTERQEDSALRLEAHHSAWYTHFQAGEARTARDHCDEGRQLYDFEQHHLLASSYGGHDPGVCAWQHAGLVDWLLGYPDQALADLCEAVRLAERLHHRLSLSIALTYDALLHLFRREPDQVIQRANEADALIVEQRLAPVLDIDMLRGAALLAQDAIDSAAVSIRAGLAKRPGWALGQQFQMTLASEGLERAGDPEGARAALVEAEAGIKAGGERWWEAEIHRRKGTLLLARNMPAESQSCFERSIAVARRQQAKSLELRAATSLARLWGETGRRAEARELLAPVYDWFTEGLDTAALKEAKALLAALA